MSLRERACGLKQASSSLRDIIQGTMKVSLDFREVSLWSGKSFIADERS